MLFVLTLLLFCFIFNFTIASESNVGETVAAAIWYASESTDWIGSFELNYEKRGERADTHKKMRCSFHNWCTLHNAHRSVADELRLSITISSFVRSFWLGIYSFAILFIYLSCKWKWKLHSPSNVSAWNNSNWQREKSERDFIESNNKYKSSVWVKSTALVFFFSVNVHLFLSLCCWHSA